MVICVEQGADLHIAQLMPLPLTLSCFSKIQIDFTFLVPAHLGSPGQRAIKRVCVCLCSAIYIHRKHGTACHHTTLLQQLIDISHLPGPQQQTCCNLLQIDFTFLVPVYPGCPGKEAVKRV